MEMAFIRLCEPKLETDPDAINQRLSALERAVQNGVPAAPVKTVQSPAPAARPAPAQPTVPPTQQPTPAAAAPAPEAGACTCDFCGTCICTCSGACACTA